MQHSKLVNTLKLLREEELKRLGKFLRSPYYNSNAHITECYLHLRKYYPDFNTPKLTKEKVFQKLFPERAYDHQKLLNLMSDFTALVEKYLWTLQVEKERLEQQKLLLRAYAERRDAYEFFIRQFQEINKTLEASPFRDALFYREKFEAEQLYFNHSGTDKFKLTETQYKASMRHLDQYFVLEKLLLSCEVKAREIPLSEQHEVWMLEEILSNKADFLENPVAGAYAEILNLLSSEKEENYFKLKTIFQNHFQIFNKEQQQNILTSLLNFVIKRGNAGDTVYVRESFEWYKMGIEQRLLFQDQQLNDRIFTNVALLASKLNEVEWCLGFIETYDHHLEERIRADAKTYCLAFLHYGQKKHTAAIDYLNSIKFVNDFYQLGARSLLLRIYFEEFQKDQSFYDLLFTQSKTFEKYLRRNTHFSQERISANLDFVLTLRQLIKLKTDQKTSPKIISTLRSKIEKKPVAYRNWLLEQLALI